MIYYEGDSPDEAALLEALRENDILFTKRTTKGITLSVFGKEENFEILKVIDFSSARKRMTIIVKSPEGNIELFCKGADNVILERQAKNTDRDFLEMLNTAITEFSRQGLRTLLVAHVPLTEKEYEEFAAKYNDAETSIEGRQEKMEAVAEELEQNLTILGATAVEDKLQEEVAETIDYLLRVKTPQSTPPTAQNSSLIPLFFSLFFLLLLFLSMNGKVRNSCLDAHG